MIIYTNQSRLLGYYASMNFMWTGKNREKWNSLSSKRPMGFFFTKFTFNRKNKCFYCNDISYYRFTLYVAIIFYWEMYNAIGSFFMHGSYINIHKIK